MLLTKSTLWIGILVLLLGGLTWFTVGLYFEKESSEKRIGILEGKFDELEEENFRLLDSLQKFSEGKDPVIEQRVVTIEEMQNLLQSLNNDKNEAAIDNMRDPDSISVLFARYFPDKSGAGETGY